MLIPVEPESLISSATSSLLEIDLPGGAKLAITAPSQISLAAALIR
jgi:hypothetical protein